MTSLVPPYIGFFPGPNQGPVTLEAAVNLEILNNKICSDHHRQHVKIKLISIIALYVIVPLSSVVIHGSYLIRLAALLGNVPSRKEPIPLLWERSPLNSKFNSVEDVSCEG